MAKFGNHSVTFKSRYLTTTFHDLIPHTRLDVHCRDCMCFLGIPDPFALSKRVSPRFPHGNASEFEASNDRRSSETRDRLWPSLGLVVIFKISTSFSHCSVLCMRDNVCKKTAETLYYDNTSLGRFESIAFLVDRTRQHQNTFRIDW